MSDPSAKTTKWKVEVQLDLEDGSRIVGFLFVTPLQRISDLLNDPRRFLPVLTTDGLIVHLSKSSIAKLVQLHQCEPHVETSDPFEILGVARNSNDNQLRDAYHALCKDYHPDRMRGLGLPADIISLANARLVRIIDAYRRISALRHGAPSDPRRARS